MPLRYLIGPWPPRVLNERLPEACSRGECLSFDLASLADAGSWQQFAASRLDDFRPDFLVLDLEFAAVPPWLVEAPLPVLGIAGNGMLGWHGLRDLAPYLDLVLADAATVEQLRQARVEQVLPFPFPPAGRNPDDEGKQIADETRWQEVLTLVEAEWPSTVDRSRRRQEAAKPLSLLGRSWRALAAQSLAADAGLSKELVAALERNPRDADVHLAAGVLKALPSVLGKGIAPESVRQAAKHFQQALESSPHHLTAALNLVEALFELRQEKLAGQVADGLLQALDADGGGDESLDLAPHFPPGPDPFNHEWERAAWDHAGSLPLERRAKRTLMRWRLHLLLSEMSGDLSHYHEAVLARPDLPLTRAMLGCALGRMGKMNRAIPHLRHAILGNPYDADASRALYQALTETKRHEEAACLAQERRRLHEAARDLVPAEPWFVPPSAPAFRLKTLPHRDFVARYGNLDTSRALCGFTPSHDTHAVLTLLAHMKPSRVVEIGTAVGHMTANLTEWSPEGATVYSLGTTAEMAETCRAEQRYEAPPPNQLGRFAGHFGKGHKAKIINADSVTVDFRALAPIDFAFIDGAHDLEHVLSDTRNVYANLRPGGCIVWHDFGSPTPWVEVRQAIEQARLPETVYHVEGTQVAFLFKGRGEAETGAGAREPEWAVPPVESVTVGLSPPTVARPLSLAWEGGFHEEHSLALVNREICGRLIERGHDLRLLPLPSVPGIPTQALPATLAERIAVPSIGPVDVHVRHSWPPDLNPPREGHWVVMQPWEFGSLPTAWLVPFRDQVDEVWVPSRHVRDGYLASGLSAERVHVVPNGVDTGLFNPSAAPLPLRTAKRFKFLFVGGTLWRKGIDILLKAYGEAFTADDDVGLVIKDMGSTTFYRGQTAKGLIDEFRKRPGAPEVEYLDASLSTEQLAGLYTACGCLVHPYRGEGFALPVAEAMGCGLAVAVTNYGAALDYCNEGNAYLIPAAVHPFKENRVGELDTVSPPWVAEPDMHALSALLRHIVEHPDEARSKGRAASAFVRDRLTWDHAAAAVEERLRHLRTRPVRRFAQVSRPVASPLFPLITRARTSLVMIVRNEEKNLPDCLASVAGLFPEIIILDTGSTDRTKEIAAAHGAKVFDFPWVHDFAAARNEALRHATGDFVFWMDADDRLDDANRAKLRRLLGGLDGTPVAYSMKCLCLADPLSRQPTVVDHVRLFPRLPGVAWEYRVHEQILPSLRRAGCPVHFADVVIEHVGYVDPALRARKLERDLSILEREDRERPDDPFTLFNLGSVYQELGQHERALTFLRRSLNRSAPHASIVRKLYALIAGSLNLLGRTPEAYATCQEGLAVTPDDAELLIRSARLSKKLGNYPAAESALLTLLSTKPDAHFASVDPDLRGWQGRHELADVLYRQGRHPEARAQWWSVVEERPQCLPAWYGLGEIALAAGGQQELEEVARRIERLEGGDATAGVFRGRWLIGRGQFADARHLARALIARHPGAIGPRQLLADSLLSEGADFRAAEQALRDILLVDPTNGQAMANLGALLRRRLQTETAVFEEQGSVLGWVLGERYDAACLGPSGLSVHLPVLHDLARECKHVTDVGTGEGNAALAFLWAQPETLVLLDLVPCPALGELEAMAGRTRVEFRRGDVLRLDLVETDLLFLDTRHDAEQLRQELDRHAGKARKYLVLHGTTQFADEGETAGAKGVGSLVEEYLAAGTFRVRDRREDGDGLLVLERIVRASGEERPTQD